MGLTENMKADYALFRSAGFLPAETIAVIRELVKGRHEQPCRAPVQLHRTRSTKDRRA